MSTGIYSIKLLNVNKRYIEIHALTHIYLPSAAHITNNGSRHYLAPPLRLRIRNSYS